MDVVRNKISFVIPKTCFTGVYNHNWSSPTPRSGGGWFLHKYQVVTTYGITLVNIKEGKVKECRVCFSTFTQGNKLKRQLHLLQVFVYLYGLFCLHTLVTYTLWTIPVGLGDLGVT